MYNSGYTYLYALFLITKKNTIIKVLKNILFEKRKYWSSDV